MRPSLNHIFMVLILAAAGYFFYAYAAGQSNSFTRHVHYQRGRAETKIHLIQLNYLIPSFKHMVDFNAGIIPLDKGEWGRYVLYFEKVAELMPQRWDAHLFLGYCYYHEGRKEKALLSFERAIALNPQSFWGYYNLGMMALEGGNAPMAAKAFALGLNVPPQLAIQAMYTSKLFLDVRGSAGAAFDAAVENDLKQAYMNAYKNKASLIQVF